MRLTDKLAAYLRVVPRASRHRMDLLRYMGRRPALLAGIAMYEGGLLLSSRLDTRIKALAELKVSSRVGCPF